MIRNREKLKQVKINRPPSNLSRIKRDLKNIITIRRRISSKGRFIVSPLSSNTRNCNSLGTKNRTINGRNKFNRDSTTISSFNPEVTCVCILFNWNTPVSVVREPNLPRSARRDVDTEYFREGGGEWVGSVDC